MSIKVLGKKSQARLGKVFVYEYHKVLLLSQSICQSHFPSVWML